MTFGSDFGKIITLSVIKEEKMKFSLVPDFRFDKFSEATLDFLQKEGIKGVILDIDNTLEPYENPLPSSEVKEWLHTLNNNGIKTAFVSNNGKERVNTFNEELKMPAYYKAKKPFPKNLKRAMRDIGSDKSNTVMMGDQVFTDVLAGRFAGIRTILLPPIKDKTDALTKFKRLLEKPILKKYEKRENKRKKEEEK